MPEPDFVRESLFESLRRGYYCLCCGWAPRWLSQDGRPIVVEDPEGILSLWCVQCGQENRFRTL